MSKLSAKSRRKASAPRFLRCQRPFSLNTCITVGVGFVWTRGSCSTQAITGLLAPFFLFSDKDGRVYELYIFKRFFITQGFSLLCRLYFCTNKIKRASRLNQRMFIEDKTSYNYGPKRRCCRNISKTRYTISRHYSPSSAKFSSAIISVYISRARFPSIGPR